MDQHLVAGLHGHAGARGWDAGAPAASEHELQRSPLAEQTVSQPRVRRTQLLALDDEALILAGNARGIVDLRLQIGDVLQACAQKGGMVATAEREFTQGLVLGAAATLRQHVAAAGAQGGLLN